MNLQRHRSNKRKEKEMLMFDVLFLPDFKCSNGVPLTARGMAGRNCCSRILDRVCLPLFKLSVRPPFSFCFFVFFCLLITPGGFQQTTSVTNLQKGNFTAYLQVEKKKKPKIYDSLIGLTNLQAKIIDRLLLIQRLEMGS